MIGLIDYRIVFICILCLLILIVLLSVAYWFAISCSERAKAFDSYISLRIIYGSTKKARSRKDKEQKRIATIRKYADASSVFRSIHDGYVGDKKKVTVLIYKTSLDYVTKILRKDGAKSVSITPVKNSDLLELEVEL